MPQGSAIVFTRLADGTLLQRDPDGSFRPVATKTRHEALSRLADDEIEAMAADDPDHPALDDAFWSDAARYEDGQPVRLAADVVAFFRQGGGPFEDRINAVLRRYIATRGKPLG